MPAQEDYKSHSNSLSSTGSSSVPVYLSHCSSAYMQRYDQIASSSLTCSTEPQQQCLANGRQESTLPLML